jgi:hypothetical protein
MNLGNCYLSYVCLPANYATFCEGKSMKKVFFLIIIPIVTIVLTYGLIHSAAMQSLSFACFLNIVLLFGVRSFTETLNSQLTGQYFNEKAWERRGKIYETLGINLYRKFLVWIGWERVNKKVKPVNKNIKALLNLHYQTKHDELGHLIVLIIVLGFNVFVAFKFGVLKSLWLLIVNILINLYPVMLQRYNRPRIQRVLQLS